MKSDYPYHSPSEVIDFVDLQFFRFKEPKPSERAIDKIADFILSYVARYDYMPVVPHHAESRYHNVGIGLTEPERLSIIGPLEYELKIGLREQITDRQLHLAAWASLMYCWREDDQNRVAWYKKIAEEDSYDKMAEIAL